MLRTNGAFALFFSMFQGTQTPKMKIKNFEFASDSDDSDREAKAEKKEEKTTSKEDNPEQSMYISG